MVYVALALCRKQLITSATAVCTVPRLHYPQHKTVESLAAYRLIKRWERQQHQPLAGDSNQSLGGKRTIDALELLTDSSATQKRKGNGVASRGERERREARGVTATVPKHDLRIRRLNRTNTDTCLKKNQSTPRPSEHPPVMGEKMSKRLGGIKGCKYKTSSWHSNRFPDADKIGSTV